ncbi:20680_t:CDS:2, partial [Entrophospora sp. SA101]
FVKFYGPDKFENKTNGITPRRWLHQANPKLSDLITETLQTKEWLKDLFILKNLTKYADNPDFKKKWKAIKHSNKIHVERTTEGNILIALGRKFAGGSLIYHK